jgi:hypothetical protein
MKTLKKEIERNERQLPINLSFQLLEIFTPIAGPIRTIPKDDWGNTFSLIAKSFVSKFNLRCEFDEIIVISGKPDKRFMIFDSYEHRFSIVIPLNQVRIMVTESLNEYYRKSSIEENVIVMYDNLDYQGVFLDDSEEIDNSFVFIIRKYI